MIKTTIYLSKTLKKDKLLTNSSSIYLVNGGDGLQKTYLGLIMSEEEVAKGSGEAALHIAFEKLSSITPNVIQQNLVISELEALKTAKLNKSEYLIYSRTEKWTDPLGINCVDIYSDEASVVLSLYSTQNDKLLNSTRLASSNCPHKLNGIPLTTGSPESLYENLFAKWVTNTFIQK
ncbi:MAG TPA: DUF4823 domain-containing protein [Sulfurimonas sp.]|nr:DUF4823 domain-containing protein [Sulfurimonas sp.]